MKTNFSWSSSLILHQRWALSRHSLSRERLSVSDYTIFFIHFLYSFAKRYTFLFWRFRSFFFFLCLNNLISSRVSLETFDIPHSIHISSERTMAYFSSIFLTSFRLVFHTNEKSTKLHWIFFCFLIFFLPSSKCLLLVLCYTFNIIWKVFEKSFW